MTLFADGLKRTQHGLGDVASGLGKGIHGVTSTVEQGVHGATSTVGQGVHGVASVVAQGFKSGDTHPSAPSEDAPSPPLTSPPSPPITSPAPAPSPPPAAPPHPAPPSADPAPAPPPSSLLGSLSGSLTSGANALLSTPAAAVSAAQSGASLALHATHDVASAALHTTHDVASAGASLALHTTHDVASVGLSIGTTVARSGIDAAAAGLSIGTTVARSGLDAAADVVSLTTGTASLAGTALGAVVTAAADSSGAVFEPVTSGLKTLNALKALDTLADGVHAINGLPLAAVHKFTDLTNQALNALGKTPTFFDSDADGIVRVSDTVRGLVLLGLNKSIATAAAYLLHSIFSYSTSEGWFPAPDMSLPIRVANMSRTRWGKDWGSFKRIEWVTDFELDEFLAPYKPHPIKLVSRGFGVLLLLFEWGTTWPFLLPHLPVSLPLNQLKLHVPFADDIGNVVRKAILPTIISNYKKAHAGEAPINMPGRI